jgi:hypothetical protein
MSLTSRTCTYKKGEGSRGLTTTKQEATRMAVTERLGSEASANDEGNHNDASTARATDQSQVFFIYLFQICLVRAN